MDGAVLHGNDQIQTCFQDRLTCQDWWVLHLNIIYVCLGTN